MTSSAEITHKDLQHWRTRRVHLTYRELGEITGHHLRTWQKWCLGERDLPQDIHVLMDYVERSAEASDGR